MKCNPYACSDDGKKITFGYWTSTTAYLLNKDGTSYDTNNLTNLKYEQGPFKPTKESLQVVKPKTGNSGTATLA